MTWRAYGWTLSVIAILVLLLYGLAAGLMVLLRLPWDMSLPLWLRFLGGALIVGGTAFVAWLLTVRTVRDIFESTRLTWLKLLRIATMEERMGRSEPLVVRGPYRVVRHPMYTAIGAMTLGIGLVVDRTFALLGALFLCLWFGFVMAPFEERELKLLFGTAYDHYMRTTPRMIPIPRRTTRRG